MRWVPRGDRERGPFSALLAAQLFFVATTPFVTSAEGPGAIFLYAGVIGIMLMGVLVAAGQRARMIAAIVLLVIAIVAWLGPDLLPGRANETLRMVVLAVGYAYVAGMVIATVARHKRVTTDTILGGINGYLLIGLSFTMVYAALLYHDGGAFATDGIPFAAYLEQQGDRHNFLNLVYLSFVTLSTLGYGDIVPVSPGARLAATAEAVLGQLYVAIFIARLVSLEVSQRNR